MNTLSDLINTEDLHREIIDMTELVKTKDMEWTARRRAVHQALVAKKSDRVIMRLIDLEVQVAQQYYSLKNQLKQLVAKANMLAI